MPKTRKEKPAPLNLFELLELEEDLPQLRKMAEPWPDAEEAVEVESEAPALTMPPSPTLPPGWTFEDINFLIDALDKGGPLLVADTELGIPTIHSGFGAEVIHCGFGLMRVSTKEYELTFDAGGAMQRTPSGKGWTRLEIRGSYPYDAKAVRDKLLNWMLLDTANQVEAFSDAEKEEVGREPESAADKPVTAGEQAREFNHDLAHFTGTEQWYRHPTLCPHIVLLTDGALYVAEHGGENNNTAYWLIDAIASYQGEAALKRQPFQTWTLAVHEPDEEKRDPAQQPRYSHRCASLICTNGSNKELVRQEIEFTDFLPVGELKLYASIEDQPDVNEKRKTMIVLLPSEY